MANQMNPQLAYLMSEYQRKNAELAQEYTGEGAPSQESPFGEINGQMFDLRTGESLGTTAEWNVLKANKSDWSSGPAGVFGLDPIVGSAADFLQGGGGPYVGMALVGGAAAAGAGGAGAGTAAAGSAPLASSGGIAALGETALPAVAGGSEAFGAAPLFGTAPVAGAPTVGAGGTLGATSLGAAGATGGIGGGSTGLMAGAGAAGILGTIGQFAKDYGSVLGPLIGGGLGYLGADKQSDAYRDVANQYLAIGAPHRGRLEASYDPSFNLLNQPGYGDALSRMADISARSYSAKFGNPQGSPTAQAGILGDVWNQGYIPALSSYRGQLGQFGGLGLNTAGAGSLGEAGVAGGKYDALGYAAGRAFASNPYEDMFKAYKTVYG